MTATANPSRPLLIAVREILSLSRSRGGALRRIGSAVLSCVGRGRELILGNGAVSNAGNAHSGQFIDRLKNAFDSERKTGLKVLAASVGFVGGWAVLAPLSAAVVITGTLVAASNVKKIQHPTGGIVAEVPVHDGMLVKEGDLLVHLDETQARSNLSVLAKQLNETRSRLARLIAERDGSSDVAVKVSHELGPDSPDFSQIDASETSLFKARASARQNQKELLRRQISQLEEQISGLEAQMSSKAAQYDLISSELQGIQALYEKRLVPLTRLIALQREAAQLNGERGRLTSAIAETRSKISESELQIVRVDQDFRTEVMKELREAQSKEAELIERNVAARDLLNRIDIRAPTSGVVHQLSVHTIGGVIGPAEVIMEIVPDLDDLQIEARLQPNDIDQVKVGQKVLVRLSAFNQRTTPQLDGVVSYVSADLSHDKQTNAAYYTIKAELSRGQIARLGALQLVPGMPTELFLQTGSRTMMSYLLKPIADQLSRSFKQR